MKDPNERVLAYSAAEVERHFPPGFAISPSHHLIPRFDLYASFYERSLIERNALLIQPIPYVVLCRKGQILAYGRKGGDKRLIDRVSIGLGGHVNPCDFQRDESDIDILSHAIEREIHEELGLFVADYSVPYFLGTLRADAKPIDRFHVGFVFLAEYPGDEMPTSKDDAIEVLGFDSPLGILRRYGDSLETWSRMVLDELIKTDMLPIVGGKAGA